VSEFRNYAPEPLLFRYEDWQLEYQGGLDECFDVLNQRFMFRYGVNQPVLNIHNHQNTITTLNPHFHLNFTALCSGLELVEVPDLLIRVIISKLTYGNVVPAG
jgi:hypothetical protein